MSLTKTKSFILIKVVDKNQYLDDCFYIVVVNYPEAKDFVAS